MDRLTYALTLELNNKILDAIRRDLTMTWRRRPEAGYVKELVSMFTYETGRVRTRVLYATDAKYGAVSARTITDKVRALGGRIDDPEPVFQDRKDEDEAL